MWVRVPWHPQKLKVMSKKIIYPKINNLKQKINKVLFEVYGKTEGELPDEDQILINNYKKTGRLL